MANEKFPVIYQKMAGRYFKWWCASHKREADHLRITNTQMRVVCAPGLGGIMLPCVCEQIDRGN